MLLVNGVHENGSLPASRMKSIMPDPAEVRDTSVTETIVEPEPSVPSDDPTIG